MYSHEDKVEMTKKVRKEHALRCLDAESLIGESPLVTHKDLQAFTYPSDEQLEKSRVRGLYLGNYVFWDSQKQIEDMIQKFGYETHEQERTYNTYESIYCSNNASVHDYVKYLKYGYGKVNDHVARDIRLKRLTREEGLERINKYVHVKPKALDQFLQWANLSESEFIGALDQFRDPAAWKRSETGEWELTHSFNDIDLSDSSQALEVIDPREYIQTDLLEQQSPDDDYILLGRSYMDENNFKAVEG